MKYLTRPEIEQLTGYKAGAWQRKWLARSGWEFDIGVNGWPLVLRSYAESRLSNSGKAEPRLNTDSIRKVVR